MCHKTRKYLGFLQCGPLGGKLGPMPIPLMPSDQLRQLAFDYSSDLVFISFDVEEITACFGKALSANPPGRDVDEQLGLVWERVSEAVSKRSDGKPIFDTYNLVHKNNLHELMSYVEELEKLAEALREMPADIRTETMNKMLADSEPIASLEDRVDEK